MCVETLSVEKYIHFRNDNVWCSICNRCVYYSTIIMWVCCSICYFWIVDIEVILFSPIRIWPEPFDYYFCSQEASAVRLLNVSIGSLWKDSKSKYPRKKKTNKQMIYNIFAFKIAFYAFQVICLRTKSKKCSKERNSIHSHTKYVSIIIMITWRSNYMILNKLKKMNATNSAYGTSNIFNRKKSIWISYYALS